MTKTGKASLYFAIIFVVVVLLVGFVVYHSNNEKKDDMKKGKYEMTYVIHYSSFVSPEKYIVNDYPIKCTSVNGSNYIIAYKKNGTTFEQEEILATTAAIEVTSYKANEEDVKK